MNSTEYHAFGIERVTISLGLSSIQDNVQNPTEMIDLADKALYYAKNHGRNRVVVWKNIMQDDAAKVVTDSIADQSPVNRDSAVSSNNSVTAVIDVDQLHARIK